MHSISSGQGAGTPFWGCFFLFSVFEFENVFACFTRPPPPPSPCRRIFAVVADRIRVLPSVRRIVASTRSPQPISASLTP